MCCWTGVQMHSRTVYVTLSSTQMVSGRCSVRGSLRYFTTSTWMVSVTVVHSHTVRVPLITRGRRSTVSLVTSWGTFWNSTTVRDSLTTFGVVTQTSYSMCLGTGTR